MRCNRRSSIYLVGSLFVGIAFQPFVFMLIGLQCGLWSYLQADRFAGAIQV